MTTEFRIPALFVISAAFLVYTFFVYSKEGVLSSISASSYRLENNVWFSLFLIAMALPTYFLALGWWGSLCGIGFVIAGLTPQHKKGPTAEDEMHLIGTVVAIVALFVGIGFAWSWWPAVAMAVGSSGIYALRKKKGDHIWWIECWAFLAGAIGIIGTTL